MTGKYMSKPTTNQIVSSFNGKNILYAYDKSTIGKYRLLAVFAFLVTFETSSDALLPNILEPKMEIIMIGRMKIQAFHKPNSKAGISDTISLFLTRLSHI
jgi:hypothetical protein